MAKILNRSHGFGALREPASLRTALSYELDMVKHKSKGVTPPKVDLRQHLMGVRDQGDSDTCVAFATACVKEYQERISCGLRNYFSPQFIYNHRQNTFGTGMYLNNAGHILMSKGCCLEQDFPFNSRGMPNDAVYKKALNYIASDMASVKTVDGLRTAIYNNGPCIAGFDIYNEGDDFWKDPDGKNNYYASHCVAVVGYDDADSHFILRNSWGSDWGKGGYSYWPYSQFKAAWSVYTFADGPSIAPNPMPPSDNNEKSDKRCGKCILM
jgi:hypothetical protein